MRSLYWDTFGEAILDVLDVIEKGYTHRNPIKYEKDKYVLTLELPGVKEKDLELSFEKETLRIKSPRGDPYRLYIGSDIDDEKITATLEDGILTITFPKKQSSSVKTITISKS